MPATFLIASALSSHQANKIHRELNVSHICFVAAGHWPISLSFFFLSLFAFIYSILEVLRCILSLHKNLTGFELAKGFITHAQSLEVLSWCYVNFVGVSATTSTKPSILTKSCKTRTRTASKTNNSRRVHREDNKYEMFDSLQQLANGVRALHVTLIVSPLFVICLCATHMSEGMCQKISLYAQRTGQCAFIGYGISIHSELHSADWNAHHARVISNSMLNPIREH